MKCVRLLGKITGIARVTDAEAEKLVQSGYAEYCPKRDWRAYRAKAEGR